MFYSIFQFAPRFFGFLLYLVLTLFIALLTKSVFARSLAETKKAETISKVAFWSVFGLLTPFLMSMAGFSMTWLYNVQISIANAVKTWPVWFTMSLGLGLVFFIVREAPKMVTSFRTLVQTNDL